MRLFSIGFFVATVTVLASYVNLQCYDQEITNDSFEVKCPRGSDEIIIVCHSDIWTNFTEFHVPHISKVTFDNCTFSGTMKVHQVLQLLSSKVHESVIFRKFPSTPKRQNFQGLSIPRLELSGDHLDEISSDLFYDVLNLEKLKISNTDLVRIPEVFFADWSQSVLEVDLRENKLRKIAKNDFIHLANVTILYLQSNEIVEIEDGAFDNLFHLHKIILTKNQLHTLPPFNRLSRLSEIDLSYNYFDELPQDLLKNIQNLESFTLAGNQGSLKTLPNGFFENLSHLEIVTMIGNQLETLPSDLFTGCSKLSFIYLNHNQLRKLPFRLFHGAINLQHLRIGWNHLEVLPAGIFIGLDCLEELDISHNKLTTLTAGVLDGLQSLHGFYASGNSLTRIDRRFISYLKSADGIDLSHNQLTFEKLNRSESFDYQDTSITVNSFNESFASDFKNKTSQQSNYDPNITMKKIDLSGNRIARINDEVINIMKNSRDINLSNNQISNVNLTELSSGLAGRKNEVIHIHLLNNPIHCDCNLIDFVRYIKGERGNRTFKTDLRLLPHLEIDKVTCTSPAQFEGLKISLVHPEELSCPFKVSDTEDACNGTCFCREYPVKQVLAVDCSNRNLTQLPSMIHIAYNWSIELNMAGNMLKQAPSLNDSYLKNIISLNLSNNNINKVRIDLFSPKLKHLQLHGNQISRLDSNIIEYLSENQTLHNITLHNNKWICDCETRQFLSFVKMTFATYDFYGITCYGTNKKLYKMSLSELCEDTIVIPVIVSLLIALLGIAATLLGLYYRYQQQIKVWLYSKQLCLGLITEDELDKDKEYDAFISFSHKDEDFVEKEIIAKLEGGPRPYKLCLHYRDWLAGEWIPVQISRSVEESRRTIVVLTPNFLESVWGLMEFRAAHTQALKEGRARLIVILCGDIGNVDDLDQEMKDYLRLNTYIKWGDPWFWDKLRYALPHTNQSQKRKS